MGVDDVIEPVLKSVETTGGGWPVLVLIIVIGVIAYFTSMWMQTRAKAEERRDIARKAEYDQRLADRKAEYETQLERERLNTQVHREDKLLIADLFNKNSATIAEFSGTQRELISTLRPMADTLSRIDKHIEQQSYQQRGG